MKHAIQETTSFSQAPYYIIAAALLLVLFSLQGKEMVTWFLYRLYDFILGRWH